MVFELRLHEQRSVKFETCTGVDAVSSVWITVLETQGFLVQNSQWTMEFTNGEAFAIRFRKGQLVGDLVSDPIVNRGENVSYCRSYAMRVQLSLDPEPWRLPFTLMSLPMMGPLFKQNSMFPSNYP
jgi:hypothetical protein